MRGSVEAWKSGETGPALGCYRYRAMQPIQPEIHSAFLLVPLFIIVFTIAMLVIAVAGTAFWIWMLIDCAQNEPSAGNDKVVWLLIIIFTHFIGALIYFFVRRGPRRRMGSTLPPLP